MNRSSSLPTRWLRRSQVAVLALTGALLTSGTASAQGWLADRRYTEGAGIKTGDLELHPGIGGEVGYDSNWFLRSSNEGPTLANSGPAKDAAVFRITPSFYLSTIGTERLTEGGTRVEPRMISFRGGASATGRFFIGEGMSKQHNVGVASDARLDIAQGRPLGFGIFAGYNRMIQPQVLGVPELAFNRSDLRAGGELVAIPGGGTLDIRGGYSLNAALYEESNGVPFTHLTHEIAVRDRWRFRPRTALFSDTSLRFINYPNAGRSALYLNDSTPLRTRFGLSGLVTDRFGVLVSAGYGATFFQNPAAGTSRQFDSVSGQAEATLYLSPGATNNEPGQSTLLLSTVSLGFVRDFQNSLLANYYTTNKVYARLEYWFGGTTVVRLDAYGEQLEYPQAFGGAAGAIALSPGDFTNYRIGGGAFAEYRITSSFGLNTTINYLQQISDTVLTPGGGALVFDQNFRRFQAFVGARYFF